MREKRARLVRLMRELGMTRRDLVHYVNESPSVPYRVTEGEVADAVSGSASTPKAGRIAEDCAAHLERLKGRLEASREA